MLNPSRRASVRRLLVAAGALAAVALSTAPSNAAQSALRSAPADCPKYYFCGYKKANFQKLGFKYKDCKRHLIPDGMGTGGSWYNNQSRYTVTDMPDKDQDWIFHGSWKPVWYVQNVC